LLRGLADMECRDETVRNQNVPERIRVRVRVWVRVRVRVRVRVWVRVRVRVRVRVWPFKRRENQTIQICGFTLLGRSSEEDRERLFYGYVSERIRVRVRVRVRVWIRVWPFKRWENRAFQNLWFHTIGSIVRRGPREIILRLCFGED
jgi:hypothetical protein